MMAVRLSADTKRRVYELMRAMLCEVSWNFRAVWLAERGPKSVTLRFLLEFDEEDDREAIDDIAFEFEAQQDAGIDLAVLVDVSQRPLVEFIASDYLVYARMEK